SLQSTGLSAALNDFFLSWQQLANNPQDSAQKYNVRTKADTLATNLKNMNQQLTAAQSSADSQVTSLIQQANLLLNDISTLSTQITRQENGTTTATANDLRDQRDQMISKLSAIMPVQQVSTLDGSLLLQSVGGDLLVQDGVAHQLARGTAPANGFGGVIIAETGQVIKNIGLNGSIGGQIELRDNKLGSYIQQVDSIAANLAFAVNQVHGSANAGTASTTMTSGQTVNAGLTLDDPAQATAFATQIISGSFKIHSYDAAGVATPAGGSTINITAGLTTMNDVVTSLNTALGATGTASLDAGNHLNITAAAGSSFTLSDDSSNMLAAFEVNSFFTGSSASTLDLAAAIKANPATINTGQADPVTSAISTADNSAAITIMQLQDQALAFDGSASASLNNRTSSVSTQYGFDVGNSVQQQQYRNAEFDSLNAQRQAISGVNTDEELVSMIKLQRAYEASAKVITTANQMMTSLMGLIR
ncbi:MAG: flagellar basal body rod C-terminal domain-containing protein, partial [Mariprofundus sp.]